MDVKLVFFILAGLMFTIFGIIGLFKLIKEVMKIKIGSFDGYIKATVIYWKIFTTGDIYPVLSYMVNGEEKIYEFHFVHSSKEYPIGKEVELRLSSASGLAYDKKDLIQGFLVCIFALLFFGGGVLIGVYRLM